MDEREGSKRTQDQEDLEWYKVKNPASLSSTLSTMPEDLQNVFPASDPIPENLLRNLPPKHSFQFSRTHINSYHPLPKPAFTGNPSFPNTAYDPILEADFCRLNLSTPSRSSHGLGLNGSFLGHMSDSPLNPGFPHISNSQLNYRDFSLQSMRAESAARGQTGLYLEPHGLLNPIEEGFKRFGLNHLNPNSLMYNINPQNNNGGGYENIDGLDWSNRANQNGYEMGYEGQTTLNRSGLPSTYDYGTPANSNNGNGTPSAYYTGYGAPASNSGNGFPSANDILYGDPASSNNGNGTPSAYYIGYGAPASNGGNGFPSAHDILYGVPGSSNNGNGFPSTSDILYGASAGSNNSDRVRHVHYEVPASLNRNGLQSLYEMETDYGALMKSKRNGLRERSVIISRADNLDRLRSSSNGNGNNSSLSERLYMRPFEEWRGNIVFLAKDQTGYASLKKKLEEGKKEEIDMIFLEVKDHVRELMMHQYGNYPIQTIFQVCSENQMTQMLLLVVSDENYLKTICVNTHGTRAMQTMVDNLSTQEQVNLVMSVLNRIALFLIKDMTGYRVIERCLTSFRHDDNRHILHIVADMCSSIAMDQAGCCVLQQCVSNSEGEPKQRIINEIIRNTLILSENIYGNYVVQYIIGMKVRQLTEGVMEELKGCYIALSMNKYGSNVVEKCLKESDEDQSTRIISEIISSDNFVMVLQDQYGNYVVQTALDVAKGTLHHTIVSLIQLHYPYLHCHPHGKRVIAKIRGNGRHHHRRG